LVVGEGLLDTLGYPGGDSNDLPPMGVTLLVGVPLTLLTILPGAFAAYFGWREALAQQVGPPAAVIAHSLGAMAAVLASFDRLPQAVVFIAPILDLREALSRFCARARLAPWTVQSLRRRVRRFVGERWHEVTIGAQADIPGASILIMHDPEDPDAPFATAVALAERRPDTHLVELAGLGHRRALKDPAAIDTVVAFVSSVLTGTPGVRPRVPR